MRRDENGPAAAAASERGWVDVSARLPVEEERRLRLLAEDEKRSRASLIAYLLSQYVAREWPKYIEKHPDQAG